MQRNIIGAFLFSPLIAAISGDVALNGMAALLNTKAEFGWVTAFSAFVAYPVVLIAGIPAFLFMQHRHWLSSLAFTLAGLLLSFTALAFVVGAGMLSVTGEKGTENMLSLLLIAVVSGSVGGLTFKKLSASGAQPHQ
ncbi:MAG TPA: hypothetical protein VN639_22615 [Azonexus sp.]|nr:hypothetical protein [Azonexus sp.]